MWRSITHAPIVAARQRFSSVKACHVCDFRRLASINARMIEESWQQAWKQDKLDNQPSKQTGNDSFYVLPMFPYPSGSLHMGHVRVYTISDCVSRFRRMKGFDVLHPIGWDAFGLPAENAAIERKISPETWTYNNIQLMRDQLKSLGIAFDYSHEFATCDTTYYKWTQYLFLMLHKRGLVYQADAEVNWDPVDKTVLANEQVGADGTSWRSGAKVEKRRLKQWFIKITELAERLEDDLEILNDWPAAVKQMQSNWIGLSKGAKLTFDIFDNSDTAVSEQKLTVFTTRIDTLPGATFCAVAADHPLVKLALEKFTTPEQRASIEAFQDEPLSDDENAHGVFINLYARNPLTGAKMPIFCADYVISGYGEGALMAVPAHDKRDHKFAIKHKIPIIQVICSSSSEQVLPFTGHGQIRDEIAESLRGKGLSLHQTESKTVGQDLLQFGASQGWAQQINQMRLRDWLVSRQRYWGAPIPMVHCSTCGPVPVPEEELPVKLPSYSDTFWHNTGQTDRDSSSMAGPLSCAPDEWLHVTCPKCHGPATRETDTLDTFVDSSWYFHRFTDPYNTSKPFEPLKAARFSPVDFYVGGIEHAILHLLYSRFLHKCISDAGMIAGSQMTAPEPFKRLLTQGMVLGSVMRDITSGKIIRGDRRERIEKEIATGKSPQELGVQFVWEKMSKSKGNGVSPESVVSQFGADVCRLHVLFKAPPEKELEWETADLRGQTRWLDRLQQLVDTYTNSKSNDTVIQGQYDEWALRQTHKAIAAVTTSLENSYAFNVAIAELMKLSNSLQDALDGKVMNEPLIGNARDRKQFKKNQIPQQKNTQTTTMVSPATLQQCLATLAIMLAPMAPHFASEMFVQLRTGKSAQKISEHDRHQIHLDVHNQPWPTVDESFLVEDKREVVVQMMGVRKGSILVPANLVSDNAQNEVLKLVEQAIEEQGLITNDERSKIIRTVVVLKAQSPIVNFVTKKQKK